MGFLLRNWHLKLGAVLVATILYTGFVFSGTLREDTLQVPIQAVNQSGDAYNLTGDLGLVVVTYRIPEDASSAVVADAFVARVDLSQYDLDRAPEPQTLPVTVTAEGLDVLDWSPETVRVRLDRTETRSVPVVVDTGDIPDGLEIGDPELSETDGMVEVRGPASEVARVDRAIAPVLIDPSGIDFDQPVELRAVDIEGQEAGGGRVELSPEIISVRIDVEAVETTKTVPVRPDIGGTPAPGFALESLSVRPSTVTLRGLPEALREVTDVATEPIDISGATGTQAVEATLVLPEGTSLARAGAEPVATVEASIGPSVGSRSFVVGVVCEGAGENGCQPALGQLTLTLSGPAALLGDLAPEDLTPTVDVTGFAPGTYNLSPVVPSLPNGIDLLQLVPGTITVRVVAPSTPAPSPAP